MERKGIGRLRGPELSKQDSHKQSPQLPGFESPGLLKQLCKTGWFIGPSERNPVSARRLPLLAQRLHDSLTSGSSQKSPAEGGPGPGIVALGAQPIATRNPEAHS